MIDRTAREREIAEELGVSPFHPMIREAVEIERGERGRDGTWITKFPDQAPCRDS